MIRNPGHVAVVGCGFTGTVALRELVNNHRVRRVTVLERSGRFGPGFAYAPDECLDYLLNNRTDTMPIAVDDRTSFLAWLQARPERFGPVPADGHVPRAWFGEFLLHCVHSTLQVARQRGIEVRLVPEEVVGLDRGPGSLLVLRTPSGTIEADAVLLATGRCPSAPPYPAPARARPDRWFSGHVNAPRLDALPGDATVHVLGSSLSALDVVHRLFGTATGARFVRDRSGKLQFEDGGNERRVVLCSRSGALPALQSQRAATLSRTVTGRRALLARARCGGIDLPEARA